MKPHLQYMHCTRKWVASIAPYKGTFCCSQGNTKEEAYLRFMDDWHPQFDIEDMHEILQKEVLHSDDRNVAKPEGYDQGFAAGIKYVLEADETELLMLRNAQDQWDKADKEADIQKDWNVLD